MSQNQQGSQNLADYNDRMQIERERQAYLKNESGIADGIEKCGGISKWDEPIPYRTLDVGHLMRKVWVSPVNGELISYISQSHERDKGFPFRCMSFDEMVILHSFSRDQNLMNYPRVEVSGFRNKQHVQEIVTQSNDRASVKTILESGVLREMIANAQDVPDDENERKLSGLQLSLHRVDFIDKYMKAK